MQGELSQLYQQVILDHNKNPRNFGHLMPHTHYAQGHNPLCGDHLDLYMNLDENGIVREVKFEGQGCAISKASASIMTTMIIGKNLDEIKIMFEKFHEIVTSPPEDEIDEDSLGKLAVFAGVREFPARVKCASLAWHTLTSALGVIPSE